MAITYFFSQNCNYQNATRWDLLPFYTTYHRITIWLIHDGFLISVCLVHDLTQGLYSSNLTYETGLFELASTNTLLLKANWLAKYSIQKCLNFLMDLIQYETFKTISNTSLKIMKYLQLSHQSKYMLQYAE